METVERIRRARLALLIEEAGGAVSLAATIQRSASQVSQWLNASPDSKTGKPRAISNSSARLIENAMRKPPGWMDQPIVAADPTAMVLRHANTEPGQPADRAEFSAALLTIG